MTKDTSKTIYAAARALLPILDESVRSKVETLLAQNERGEDTHLQILNILAEEDTKGEQIRNYLKGIDGEMLSDLGLYGNPFTSDANLCYLCSADGGHLVSPDEVEERDVFDRALCPTHHQVMEPKRPCSMER